LQIFHVAYQPGHGKFRENLGVENLGRGGNPGTGETFTIFPARWLAPRCIRLWCPLADNRGEWGSLFRGTARS